METNKQQVEQLPRRQWLKGVSLSALGIGAALGAGAGGAVTRALGSTDLINESSTLDTQPFYGKHQAGIATPQPAAAIVVTFDVLAKDKKGLEKLFRTLTDRISFLTQGGEVAQIDAKLPPTNSGILGNVVIPDNLTVTVSLGASLFDARFGLTAHKPKHLVEMNPSANDNLELEMCHGDISLQICSNTAETNIHALRDIIKNTPDLMALRWKMDGFLPPHVIAKRGKETGRNLLGFKDGTSNLNAKDESTANELLWVGEQSGEPAWAKNGSYQVLRLIRNRVEFWDRTPLQEQETIMGRHKISGAPLGMKGEHDDPNFGADLDGARIPHDAHIRLANPRTAETRKNLILRRGYNYSRGMSKSGQLDMGLLFVCYQADLQNGFIAVQKRLDGESLEEYIKPFGGGFFFSLGGVAKGEYLGMSLINA